MTNLAKISSLIAAALPAVSYASVATVTRTPAEDSYVNNANVSQNNGSAPGLIANNNGGDFGKGVRVIFLRFDLSGIETSTITNLKLDLTVSAAKAQGYSIYGLKNENWTESDITWNNAPGVVDSATTKPSITSLYLKTGDLYGSGAVLANFTSLAKPGPETVFDVSSGAVLDFIKTAAGKSVTFLIVKQDEDQSTSGTVWNSREAASGQPLLTITTQVPESSPYVLIGAGAFAVVAGLATAGVVVVRRRSKRAANSLPPPPSNASPAASGRSAANSLPPPPQ